MTDDDDDYDPFEDPTMFRAPKFLHDTASDIMNALHGANVIDEFRVVRPKVQKSDYALNGLTAARGVRHGEPDGDGRTSPWFTIHVETIRARAFEGLMEGNPYGALLTRVLEKMNDPNTFAIVGDGQHWVMWFERDGGAELNENLSLGPEILHIAVRQALEEGELIWMREPRYSDVEELVADLGRVPGIHFNVTPGALWYPYQAKFGASLQFSEELGSALQNSYVGDKGVDFEVEVLIESSYKNDIALRMEARKPADKSAAYVSGDGWAIRITVRPTDRWVLVNEPGLVAALISQKIGGTVTTQQ